MTIGDGIAAAAVCILMVLIHPLGWLGMLVAALIYNGFVK